MAPALALLCAGCHELDLQFQTPEERAKRKAREKGLEALRGERGHSQLLGDYLSVRGLTTVALEGIGLVTGLDGTGDDPPASTDRAQLLDDMQRRDIKDPNKIIADSNNFLNWVKQFETEFPKN